LYIVPYTPTPIRTRPYYLLQQLARDGFHITLATLAGDELERDALAHWRANGVSVIAEECARIRSNWNMALAAVTAAPLQAAFCWQPALMRKIRRVLETSEFDVIQVEHLRGAWYGLEASRCLDSLGQRTPVIWDSVDCITHLFEQSASASASRASRWVTAFELPRTRKYEPWLVRQFSRTLVVSESERCAFCNLLDPDCSAVVVIPNGVALDYFSFAAETPEPATILLTGKMSYHANITAAFYLLDEIMPRVWQEHPNVRVCIAGQNPPPSLQDRAGERIEVTGYVADLRPYFARATVVAAPLVYGAGIQNKVLEAMACGKAVVATPQALGALEAVPEQCILMGKDAEHFGRQLVRVLTDTALRQGLGKNARAYVETNHAWATSTRALAQVYMQARSENEHKNLRQ
jgi:glycosyltransferase involved in cell wall biosynthesis